MIMKRIPLLLLIISSFFAKAQVTPQWKGPTPILNSKDSLGYFFPEKIGGYSWLYNGEYIRSLFLKKIDTASLSNRINTKATMGNVATITPIISGQNTRWAFLSSTNPTVPTTLVIYFHGSGEDENAAFTQVNEKKVTDYLIQKGCMVVSSYAHGNAWGNQNAQDDYFAVYQYAIGNFNINKVIFYGQSMGGETSLNLLASGRIPVNGWYGSNPSTNLSWAYNNGFATEITAAYGISGGNPYATATAGYDPYLASVDSLAHSVRFRMTASYSDAVIQRAYNSDLLYANKLPDSLIIQKDIITAAGPHGDASHFIPMDVWDFISQDNLLTANTQKRTFFGTVQGSGKKTNTPNTTSQYINNFVGGKAYWSFRTGISNDFNIDVYNGGVFKNAFKIKQDGTVSLPLKITNGIVTTSNSDGTILTITDNHINWDLAYSQTRQWDGGATGLVAATGRASLGLVPGTNVEVPLTFSNGLVRTANNIAPTYGTISNTFAQGNDSRINNGQTAFGWGNHAGLYTLLAGGNTILGLNEFKTGVGTSDATEIGTTFSTTNTTYLAKGHISQNFNVFGIQQNWIYNGSSFVADDVNRSAAGILLTTNSNDGNIKFYTSNINNAGGGTLAVTIDKNQNIIVTGNTTATGFKTPTGTSAQGLAADGSVFTIPTVGIQSLASFYTDVASTTSAADAYSYTVAANSLTTNGQYLDCVYTALQTGGAINTIIITFGGQTVYNNSANNLLTGTDPIGFKILRSGTTTARCQIYYLTTSGSVAYSTQDLTGVDFTTTNIIKASISSATAGTLTMKSGTITIYK
jgi:hypothetical protein